LGRLGGASMKQHIEKLRLRHPWPAQRPGVPLNAHGWFRKGNQVAIRRCCNASTQVYLELGSWLGKSTRYVLRTFPHITVIAVDHWVGSAEHQEKYAALLPRLYEIFLTNCWGYRARLIPLRMTTAEGMAEVKEWSVSPDVVFVDAAHDYDSVGADIELAHECFPKARLLGDDFGTKPGVTRAVKEFANRHGYRIIRDGPSWSLWRKNETVK